MFNLISSGKILLLLMAYRYAIFFPLTVIEGPIVTVIAGFLCSIGFFNFWLVYAIAMAGDIVGDALFYLLGRWGGERILKRGRFLWIKTEQLGRLQKHFQSHVGKIMLFGKWTQSVGAPILLAAGMARVSLKKYFFFNIIGSLPKVYIFLIIGIYFGRAYQQIDKYFGYAMLSIFFAIILIFITYLLVKRFKKNIGTEQI
ncbi:MAG: hypothetical protein CO001_02695 [Candidatus Portnoybacteria bacterium CG_4_8_14_3_um_filter_40_10]|uniref:VTT domain-containing protein n=1 Tax=Candidatus Portnoybacteria bacterium CG_4_8_14_3_um_filter_40_10 TaxID=1974801 RepID=A0A2M7II24_9BACT|nr:MAG: hypothetical protein CO001_02695 [Candidatus Portnoybacteria bacterium CG_4_8_14_3_um_filter_40_10]